MYAPGVSGADVSLTPDCGCACGMGKEQGSEASPPSKEGLAEGTVVAPSVGGWHHACKDSLTVWPPQCTNQLMGQLGLDPPYISLRPLIPD